MELGPCAMELELSAPTTHHNATSPSLITPASPSPSNALIEEGDDSEDEDYEYARMQALASYDFRPSARDGKQVFITTWLDLDQSGDYDPQSKGKLPERREGRRATLTRRDSPNGYGDRGNDIGERQSNRVRLSKLAARQKGFSMVVSLPMTSIAAKTLASTIPDHWPEETWNYVSDEYVQRETLNLDRSGRRTRRTRCDDDGSRPLGPSTGVGIPDPLQKEPDLTGHPAARGCVECRESGETCPLLSEGSSWPCYLCVQDDFECELLTPPVVKATCEACKEQKKACSYIHDLSDPTQPCAHCIESGSHCVAGPGFRGIRERIHLDRDYTKPRPPDPQGRKYVSCTECRSQNKKCSLKKKEDVPPCDGCLASNTSCTFDRVNRIPPKSERHSKVVVLSPAVTNSAKASQVSAAPSEGNPSDAQMISTSLCHPVLFMQDEEGRCDWCRDGSDGLHNSKFGILGHGWEDVMVKPSAEHGDRAFDEVCGGHAARDVRNTAMCSECSMKRVQIIRCEGHEMRVLTELYKSSQQPGQRDEVLTPESLYGIDFDGPYTRLEEGTLKVTDKFCDLCPSLSLFKCCTVQDTDAWGEPVSCELPEAEGCGLVLCEDCKVCHDHLTGGEENALDELIKAILQEKEAAIPEQDAMWHMGIRADAELLLADGFLSRHIMNMMAADEEEEGGDEMDIS
ncbi:hypothetical protein FKW77_001310 [Venturia effusa]|uniref:Zn(2)-C6 fungal-type domain-containing protein n=1 Tax=Venturia effusa TaxID=50376 RepID=A0A517LD75_9PEZI|nr:hypothetical protein FKW77_001310 [Venturia effusa]